MKEHLRKFGPIAALLFASLLALYIAWRVAETGFVLFRTTAVSWSVRKWDVAASLPASTVGAATPGSTTASAGAAATTATQVVTAPAPPPASPEPPKAVSEKSPSGAASSTAKYESIVKKGMFGMAPTPPPAVHVLTGVIGSKAIVDGELVAVGATVGDAKVVEIRPKMVVLEREGQRSELQLFK